MTAGGAHDTFAAMDTTESTARLTDAELVALAGMAQVEAVIMAGDNAECALQGRLPIWRDGCGYMPAATRLYDELYNRGLLP